jgi:hypothetical protein
MEQLGVNVRLATNSSNEFLQQAIVKALPYANKQMQQIKVPIPKIGVLRVAQNLPKILGISYKADSWKNQNIQLPSSLVNTKVGDCKSFALLIAGFLQDQGIRNGVVFVGYGKGATQPTHIYNFAILDGKQYWIDGTLPADRIPANRAKETLQIEVMNTNLIAQSYQNELGAFFDEDINGKKGRERRAKRRAEGKGFGQKVKKVGLAPARGALLALIALNVHGLASRMQAGYKKNPKALEGLWKKVGGKFEKLIKTVNTGAKKKRILGVDPGVGVVATATLLASAAPILVAVAKLLKDLKVEEAPGEDLAALIPEGTEPLGADFEVTDPDDGSEAPRKKSGSSENKKPNEKSGGFEVGTPVLLGSAALLLLLLTNK